VAEVILFLCIIHFSVVTVKKWLKSMYFYGSYRKINTGFSLLSTTP